MNALLDTCAVIWLANQDGQLPARARDAIEQLFTLLTPDPKIRQDPNLKTLW